SRTRCGHREEVPGLPAEILVERFLLPSTKPAQAILRRALRHRHVLHPPLLTPQRVAGLLGRAMAGRKERSVVSFTLHPLCLLRVPPHPRVRPPVHLRGHPRAWLPVRHRTLWRRRCTACAERSPGRRRTTGVRRPPRAAPSP